MRPAKGRVLLLIGGIIEIVFGSIIALAAILFFVLGTSIFNYLDYSYYSYGTFGSGIILIAGFILLFVAAIYLFLGIFAVKNSNNPKRGTAIMVLGIIFGAFSLFSLFSSEFGVISLIEAGATALLIIGGVFNRQTQNQINAEAAMAAASNGYNYGAWQQQGGNPSPYRSPYSSQPQQNPYQYGQPQAPQQTSYLYGRPQTTQQTPYQYGQTQTTTTYNAPPAQSNPYSDGQPQTPVQPQVPTQPEAPQQDSYSDNSNRNSDNF